jgi:hypothetical protein
MSNSPALARLVVALWTALASFASIADPPSFRISQIYSNLDGSTQFIRLTETQGLNGQHHFAGMTLTSIHNGVTKQFVFPSDLPTDQTAHLSLVVVATWWAFVGAYGPVFANSPDFLLPARFLATDGGSIDFAGVDQMTYSSLPTDGEHALNRDLSATRAVLPPNCSSSAVCASSTIVATPAWVREYYSASLDHYFYTASAPDIDALESERFPGWKLTGKGFHVGSNPDVSLYFMGHQPVCRYYIPPPIGDSHFFSASTEECDEVGRRFPDFELETAAAFYVWSANPDTGTCEARFQMPVYRLWNRRADSNHRYTTDKNVRDAMVAQGYVSEGYGPDGVAFCVAPWSPWDY